MVVFALASTRAAEVETKHREPGFLKRSRNSKHHFVVHRPAKQRMGMANDSRARHRCGRFFEDRLDSPGGTLKEGVPPQVSHHRCFASFASLAFLARPNFNC